MNFGLLISPFLAGAIYERVGYFAVFAVILAIIAFNFCCGLAIVEKRVAVRWLKNSSLDDAAPSGERSSTDPEAVSTNTSNSTLVDSSREELGPQGLKSDEHSSLLPFASRRKAFKQSWLASRFSKLAILLSSPRFNTAVYGGFIHTMLIVSFDTILPLYVIKTFHWGATGSGMIFLAITVPSLLSIFVGMLSDRYGARLTSLSGFALLTPSLTLLSLCQTNTVAIQALLILLLILIGESIPSLQSKKRN